MTETPPEEQEIEYMPPREVPLPDDPEDWPRDRTYPQLEGNNLSRGWMYHWPKKWEEDDDTEFSDFEEKIKAAEKREKAEKEKSKQQAAKKKAVSGLQKTVRDPLTGKAPPQTLKSRSAASALATKPGALLPSFAAPTAASKASGTFSLSSKVPAANAAGFSRHTAAKAASSSTIGYSKGRAVSAGSHKVTADLFGVSRCTPLFAKGAKA